MVFITLHIKDIIDKPVLVVRGFGITVYKILNIFKT